MFGELLLGAASSVEGRVAPVSSSARASDLSARTRHDGDAAFSQKASDAAGGLAQSRADATAAKDRAADARHGKRHRADASEDERPRPRVKFKVPDGDDRIGPIFEEEGREQVESAEPLIDAADARIGRFVDVYA